MMKLRPCPKCEAPDDYIYCTSSCNGKYIKCGKCGWRVTGKRWVTEEEVDKRWNRQVDKYNLKKRKDNETT